MRGTAGTREVISLEVGASRLLGTYHRPPDESFDRRLDGVSGERIGIVFLNSLFMPRAARGDSAVYWADAFAKIGYPCFRLDMPGLGDSDGELPPEVLDFVCLVNQGYHVPVVSAAIKSLVRRFGLSGAVLVGHCAGAVSALYAAAGEGNTDVRGVVLLDPYFHLQQRIAISSRWHRRVGRRLQRQWQHQRQEIHLWALRSPMGGKLRAAYRHLKDARLRARRNTLPKNANLALIRSWERLASVGLPMLVLTAFASKPALGEFDYLSYLQPTAHGKDGIAFHVVEGATHAFLEGRTKEMVREYAEGWLHACFPRAEAEPRLVHSSEDRHETLPHARTGTAKSVGGST